MSESTNRDEDLEFIRMHAAQLGERFETVHVFCTRHMPTEMDGTVTFQLGVGNWYARYGHIREWMIKQDENARIGARRPEDPTP